MADRADRIRLFAQPVVVLAVVAGVLVWESTRQLDDIEQRNINFSTLVGLTWQHLLLAVAVTAVVVLVGVPLGIVLTRRWARFAAPAVLNLANIGQAAPAIGLMVLFLLVTASTGFWVAATRNGSGSGRGTPSTET